MVLAEVPLWVAHTTTLDGAGLAMLSGNNNDGTSKDPKNDNGNQDDSAPSNDPSKLRKAKNALSLLEGLGGAQKCAIYSVDIHPSGQKFATGGGDGTVRLWNSGGLFARHPEEEAPQSGAGDDPMDVDPRKQNGNSKRRSASYGPHGRYLSSGESSDGSGAVSSSGEDDGQSVGEGSVRDLSNVVRRKGGMGPTSSGKSVLEQLRGINSTPKSKPTNKKPRGPSSQHKLLCTLSAHTGSSVLSVRFSKNGQYLASAGDDAVVCIYTPSSASSTSIVAASNNNLEQASIESWTRIKLCRGHALDVVGLAWAPDDSHLVSCSLDSNAPIIVWKLTDLATNNQLPKHSNVLCNPYKILGKEAHTSTVKGVTFDPAGTYLASSGDDPSVCIWRAHDDWGLERRIDSRSGIFRQWKEQDAQGLSSQTLFRRLSWSTDGSYICSTNSLVKNKHVASTISREGWSVSGTRSAASGAATLVGHRQPVVVCRHCPHLLDPSNGKPKNDDEEPEYGTLLALGDKRGFVTVWSTKCARPVFKLQCSESRCTVTDLAWGRSVNDLLLLVSLLDGQVVALRFNVPKEVGHILDKQSQARVFQLRYGIDLNGVGEMGRRRLFVGENSGPNLIENALQFALEEQQADDDENDESSRDSGGGPRGPSGPISSDQVRATQGETRAQGGKKRIRPVLMGGDDGGGEKRPRVQENEAPKPKKKAGTLQDAIDMAKEAASGAEALASQKVPGQNQQAPPGNDDGRLSQSNNAPNYYGNRQPGMSYGRSAMPQIPHSSARIHSVDLPFAPDSSYAPMDAENGQQAKLVADCTNTMQVPLGSSGSSLSCASLSISQNGQILWKDQLPGTSCCAIAASKNLLAIGTSDGSIQLFGTSPSIGWLSGTAFRSHPPLVFGSPIVALQLYDRRLGESEQRVTEMLILAADGNFGLYVVSPVLGLRYKGTIMPSMTHMALSSDTSGEIHLPKLARIQLTTSGRLLLVLSLQSPAEYAPAGDNRSRNSGSPSVGAGGSLQAFVYHQDMELWMRMADSRFVLSDFYSTLPARPTSKRVVGELSKYDDAVRAGAMASSLKPSRRGSRKSSQAGSIYNQTTQDAADDAPTRSHCEDRMACALALLSPPEFEYWLSMYARTLSMAGNEPILRLLVDMLLHTNTPANTDSGGNANSCWWLSPAPDILMLDRVKLVQSAVVPEMSKNRALQRITNEIAVEVEALGTA